MHSPITSISRSSHFARTATGSSDDNSGWMRSAKRSATDMDTFMGTTSVVADANIAAETGDAVDEGDYGEGKDQHDESENGNRTEVPAFVEVKDQNGDDFGFRREQHDCGRQFADNADKDEAPGRDHAGAQQGRS